MTPTVSVITPAWNAAATLEATIASVAAQTFPDWEMLVADDGSTDATPAIAAAWAARDPRVRPLPGPRPAAKVPPPHATAPSAPPAAASSPSSTPTTAGARRSSPASSPSWCARPPPSASPPTAARTPRGASSASSTPPPPSTTPPCSRATSSAASPPSTTAPVSARWRCPPCPPPGLRPLARAPPPGRRGARPRRGAGRLPGRPRLALRRQARAARGTWAVLRREGLSLPGALWCFGHYAAAGLRRRAQDRGRQHPLVEADELAPPAPPS